jgi:cytochrome o ubiquinol oxidase operon protein cyoD
MADHAHDSGFHATAKDYVIGFALSVILTAIPFWLVMTHAIADNTTTALIITLFAGVQIVVHMIYFLHMSGKIEGGWNLMAMLFTILLLVIVLSGTLWVMFHLNANMMPVKMDGMG